MKQIKTLATLALLTLSLVVSDAQSRPTATKQLDLSVFAAGTGTFTDIEGGKNLGITVGADLTYLPLRLLRPSLEIRGTYPIDKGTIDGQKNFLLGPKVEHAFGRLHPYADFLIGRGEIDYQKGGFAIGDILYISTNSTVYSPGGGLDYYLGKGLAIKGDFQYQHWDAPVVPSGVIHPVAVSLGAVYHFNFNPRHHY